MDGIKLFELSKLLTERMPNNIEANSIAAFTSILSLARNGWDEDTYLVGYDANDVLKNDPSEEMRAEFFSNILLLQNYVYNQDIQSFETARERIIAFITTWPDSVIGYYMMAQISGVEGKREDVLRYIDGIGLGKDKPATKTTSRYGIKSHRMAST